MIHICVVCPRAQYHFAFFRANFGRKRFRLKLCCQKEKYFFPLCIYGQVVGQGQVAGSENKFVTNKLMLSQYFCSASSRSQVQNQSFGPKQNTKLTLNHHPPTYRKFFEGFQASYGAKTQYVCRLHIDQRAITPNFTPLPQSFKSKKCWSTK